MASDGGKDTVIADRAATEALVHLPRPTPEPAEPLHDPRLSDVDEWGRSDRMRSVARKVYGPVYRRWFRVEWERLDKLPAEGGALLVANHAGAIPPDALLILHGIEEELDRPVYGLSDDVFREWPVVGTLWSRLGGVGAHPDNALRLLRQGHLVLVFPEGTKATSKSWSERYQLRRFGRGGFVEIAMRAGVPIIPIAVIGAEESMPVVATIPWLARLLRVPYVPITLNQILLGPLGTLAHFPAKIRLRVLDPVRFEVPPGEARYSKAMVMEEAEGIRAKLQQALYQMLGERRSVWLG
ncbi:MAG: glycerol acyltransferase [Acidimicrobiales bacterium]|nr:MAG: glycerol acyltransferase [Acidimicrobiales bacterium]